MAKGLCNVNIDSKIETKICFRLSKTVPIFTYIFMLYILGK